MCRQVWSTELEQTAQRWADQCDFGHDKERAKLDGTYVGQNAFWSATTADMAETDVQGGLSKAAQSWYDEVTKPGFDSQNIDPFV